MTIPPHELSDQALQDRIHEHAKRFPVCLRAFDFAHLPPHLRCFSRPFAEAALGLLDNWDEHALFTGRVAVSPMDLVTPRDPEADDPPRDAEPSEHMQRHLLDHQSTMHHMEQALEHLKRAKDSGVSAFLHVKPPRED